MGHSSTPNGLSSVGMGKGTDLRMSEDMVGCQCAVLVKSKSWTLPGKLDLTSKSLWRVELTCRGRAGELRELAMVEDGNGACKRRKE